MFQHLKFEFPALISGSTHTETVLPFAWSRPGTTLLLTGLLLANLKMRSADMLSLVITLLIIALIAGILGFGGIAGAAVGIAKIVFVIALVLFVISLLTHGLRGGFGRGL